MRLITLVVAIAALAVATTPAFAYRGDHGHQGVAPASCWASNGTVSAVGLPTDQVINFMITNASGNWGWVLGFTDDGTWNVSVPAANSATTYQFVSRTRGPNGSKYDVFASCAV
jgi:hypothetical protein